MEVVEINLGGISFNASTEWMFFPYENFILARRDSQKGILRISLAENTKGKKTTPADLLKTARQFVSRDELPAPFDIKEPNGASYLFGAASYKISEKQHDFFTRVFYLARDNDLLFAVYGCPWEDRDEEPAREELNQCERMLLSVKFTEREQPLFVK
jgi:hypothetical protein